MGKGGCFMDFFNDFGGDTGGGYIGGNIMVDKTECAINRIFAYCDAGHYHAVTSDSAVSL